MQTAAGNDAHGRVFRQAAEGGRGDAAVVKIAERLRRHGSWEKLFKFSVSFRRLVTQRVGVGARTS